MSINMDKVEYYEACQDERSPAQIGIEAELSRSGLKPVDFKRALIQSLFFGCKPLTKCIMRWHKIVGGPPGSKLTSKADKDLKDLITEQVSNISLTTPETEMDIHVREFVRRFKTNKPLTKGGIPS